MTVGLQTFDENEPFANVHYIVNAAGTGSVTFVNANPRRVRIDSILAINNDSIPHVVNVFYFDGSTPGLIGSASVASGAGTAGTPSVDLLAAILPTTQVGLLLNGVSTINVAVAVAVTGANSVQLTALGGYV